MKENHLKHYNSTQVKEVHRLNKKLKDNRNRSARQNLGAEAERGFTEHVKNGTFIPERRTFI